jgi:hypothetical protein
MYEVRSTALLPLRQLAYGALRNEVPNAESAWQADGTPFRYNVLAVVRARSAALLARIV